MARPGVCSKCVRRYSSYDGNAPCDPLAGVPMVVCWLRLRCLIEGRPAVKQISFCLRALALGSHLVWKLLETACLPESAAFGQMFWVFFVPKLSDLQKIVFSGASESNSFTILLLGAGTTQQSLPFSEGSVPGSITLPKIVLNQAFGAF